MKDVIFLCSHAEKVEARVDPAGDEDHEDTREIKVAWSGHHHTESLNITLLISSGTMQCKYKLYPSYRDHCGCIQDPDGHIITESYDVSYFP